MFYVFKLSKIIKVCISLFFIAGIFGVIYIFNILYPLKYIDMIKEKSKKYELEPELVCAIINTESRFNHKAKSGKGASGLMQIMQITADWAAEDIDIKNYSYEKIFDPEINIEIGSWYISRLIKQYDGYLEVALASYNAGSGNVSKWLANPQYSKNGKTLERIPFPETSNYIKRVNKNYQIYKYLLKLYK